MQTVAFFGSSTVAGKGQAFNIISAIQKRHDNLRFINLGSGGDSAYDALQRIDTVVKADPDIIIILIGANDVLMEVFPGLKRLLNFMKSSPQKSSPAKFEKNLRTIIHILKNNTHAKIALSSLALVGENVTNPVSTQQMLNESIKLHSNIIKKIADDEKLGYIPFYESMYMTIQVHPGKSLDHFKILPMYLDAFRTLILGWTPDKIAMKNGWTYHSDGIHLNSKGALIFMDLIENYLNNNEASDNSRK